jgi:hypothetical protein
VAQHRLVPVYTAEGGGKRLPAARTLTLNEPCSFKLDGTDAMHRATSGVDASLVVDCIGT